MDALIREIKRLSAVTSAEHAGLPENAGSNPRTTPLNGAGVGGSEGGPGAGGCCNRTAVGARVGDGEVEVENNEGDCCGDVGVGGGELVSKGLGGEVGESEINIQSDGRDDVVGESGWLVACGEDDGW